MFLGYTFLGIAFGLILNHNGLHWSWALITSTFVYAGSMQFVLVPALATGMDPVTVLILTLGINSRHLFYGFPFLNKFKEMGRKYLYMIFSLTDETYAILTSTKIPEDLDENKVYFQISFFNQIYWIIGSVLGALLGKLIDFGIDGVDFAMTALFVVLLLEQLLRGRAMTRYSGLIGAVTGLASLLIFGSEKFLLPSLIVTTAVLLLISGFSSKSSKGSAASVSSTDSETEGEV